MSDAMGSDDLAGQLNELGDLGAGEGETLDSDAVVSSESPKLTAFAQSYLNTVPDEERDLVQRHVANWDKGFSKYAERMANKYGQYDQLGSFDEVQQAVTVARLISQDPHTATQWLISQGYGPQQAAQATGANVPPQQQPPQQDQLPDAVRQELQRYQMALGAMNQRFEQDVFQRDTERYQREIEAGLASVKQQHPYIPETMILHLMKGGMEMDEAVNLIVEQVQSGVNQRQTPPAPRVLSSASLPPQAAKSPSEMSDDERKASLLAALQANMGP